MKNFAREHLAKSHVSKGKYDRAQVSADLRAMADANDAGHIDLITRRVGQPTEIASDGSNRPASYSFLEWAHN